MRKFLEPLGDFTRWFHPLEYCVKKGCIGSFLARIFPYSDWMRTRKTPNTDMSRSGGHLDLLLELLETWWSKEVNYPFVVALQPWGRWTLFMKRSHAVLKFGNLNWNQVLKIYTKYDRVIHISMFILI